MNREDIQKLLGGYATGTLTPEEQQVLFSAALEDQELFDALAKEEALRDLLQDPGARAHLLSALDEKPASWLMRWWRPAALGLATAGMAVLAVVAIRYARPVARPPAAMIAQMKEPSPPAPTPAPKPAPARTLPKPAAALRQFEAPKPSGQSAEGPVRNMAPPAPELPAAPAPGGVVGGVIGGVPSGIAPPTPPPMREVPAQDLAIARFAEASSGQRARTLFYGSPASAFLGQPPAVAQKEQKTADQARTMMRNSAALAVRSGLPGGMTLSVRYTLLRKTEDGTFAEVGPGDLKAGDTVEVRFESNQPGYLSVLDSRARPVVATYMSARTPYTSAPIEPEQEPLTVRFSRAPLTGAVRAAANFIETAAGAGDRSTYVAASDPLADPLVFTLSLKRQ